MALSMPKVSCWGRAPKSHPFRLDGESQVHLRVAAARLDMTHGAIHVEIRAGAVVEVLTGVIRIHERGIGRFGQ